MIKRKADKGTGIDHHKLPVGTVLSNPIKGDFLTLPLFGWVAVRQKTGTPLVMLTVLLLRSGEDTQPRGSMSLELPIFDDTLNATVATLERFGWDGRVWPDDEGWPTSEGEPSADEQQMMALLEQAQLRVSLTFPPGDQGVGALPISVQRATGPFLMPPLPTPEAPPDPEKVKKLLYLCNHPTIFKRTEAQRPKPLILN